MQARTTLRGVEPMRVHCYECAVCGKPWDGSEAPEPAPAEALPILDALDPRSEETDAEFRARVLASVTDPRTERRETR